MKIARKILIFIFIVLPVLLVTAYSYWRIKKDTVTRIYEERRSLASLSARVLKEKLGRLNDLGLSFSTRPVLCQYVDAQKWDDAIAVMNQVPKDFAYIARILITDTAGTMMAEVPFSSELKEKNYAQRDWYKGLTKNWQPYLSEVYKRADPPRNIVTALALPIKNRAGKIRGILVLQADIVQLLEWSKEVSIGSSGFEYIVDQKGHIAASPQYAETDSVIDYSSVPAVQKALSGKKNVEILYNPIVKENRLSAYEQVPGFGWAVIVEQKASAALSENSSSQFVFIFYTVIILFALVSAYFIIREMVRRKKAEEALQNSLREVSDYKYALDESAIVSITDPKGTIKYINDNFCKISQYSREELIGEDHRIINSGYHPKEFIRDLWVTIANGKIWRGDLKNKAKDGTNFWVDTTIVPFLSKQGKPYQYITIRTEITQQKKVEEQLLRVNNELEAFTYSVSHDLRAPLRVIVGFTSILEEEYSTKLDDEAKRITSIIKTNISKMGLLIDDLLAFSHMGLQDIIKTGIHTSTMVKEVINKLASQNKGRSIQWVVHPLPDSKGDINLIRQVWINLISNAIKYSGKKEKPHIEAGSFIRDEQTVFFIKDNGVGFNKKYGDKLFKVFQRLHSPDEFEGTGVGLAIVEKIISKHGGKVWAEGEVNKGATFYFSLPTGQAGLPTE